MAMHCAAPPDTEFRPIAECSPFLRSVVERSGYDPATFDRCEWCIQPGGLHAASTHGWLEIRPATN